jgi:hypothetical protein
MSAVTPPSNAPATPPIALPRAIILNPPPQVLSLGVGAKIEAVVSQLIDTSQVRLTTNFGDVTIKLPTRIPVTIGQPVMLQLQTAEEQPRVQISAPNGQPLAAKSTVQTAGAITQASTTPQTLVPTVSGPAIIPGGQVTATILRPIAITSSLGIVQSTTSGTTNTASAIANPSGQTAGVSTSPPGASVTSQPDASSPNTTQSNASGNANAAPTGQSTTAVPAGSTLVLKVVSIQVPETPNPSLTPVKTDGPSSLQTGTLLNGIATGKQGVSQTVVQTQIGPISLPTADPLPRGTQIIFEINQLSITKGIKNHDISVARPLGAPGGGSWPALNDTLEVLSDVSPAAQTQLLQAALPRADAQLSTNVLFFLAALRGGDLKGWMGDGPLRILERQRPDLAGRLRDDMGQLSRQITDPDTGDWRMHAIPYLNNDEIDRIRLLVRDQDPDEDEDTPDGNTRFVIDLNLSKLGHLQIDGLVGNGGKRVDVVVRSDEALSAQMRDDIRTLYANAIEVTGVEGSVGFQAAPAKFIAIPEQPTGGNDGMVV